MDLGHLLLIGLELTPLLCAIAAVLGIIAAILLRDGW